MREIDSEVPLYRDTRTTTSLRDLLTPLFRRKRLLITTFAATFVLACAIGVIRPSHFTSHMAILVNRERVDPLVTTAGTMQVVTDTTPVFEEEINSEAQLLKSRDVLEKVVVANGLQNRGSRSLLARFLAPRTAADKIARAVRSLDHSIKVDVVTKTDIINVEYSSPNPQLSYNVLKALGALYLQKHVEVHRPPGSYEFFAQQTQKYQQALEASENRLRTFDEENGAAAPDLERSDLASQIGSFIGQMHSTQQSIAADQQRLQSDRQQMRTTPQRSTTKQDLNAANILLQQLSADLLSAQVKRTQLLAKYDSTYPLVQEVDQEITDTKRAIAGAKGTTYVDEETDRDPTFELLREDEAKTEANLAAQRANLRAVAQSIQSMQGQMAALDEKAITQQDLMRDLKANEANYLLYLGKREEARTSDALDNTRIANVAIAVPPGIPALPTHGFLFFVFSGLAMATLLAISAAYLADYFDPSFHTPAQVMEMLGIPVVVAVSKKIA